jgi:hypothetical protein
VAVAAEFLTVALVYKPVAAAEQAFLDEVPVGQRESPRLPANRLRAAAVLVEAAAQEMMADCTAVEWVAAVGLLTITEERLAMALCGLFGREISANSLTPTQQT